MFPTKMISAEDIEFLIIGFNSQKESLICLKSIDTFEPKCRVSFLDNGSQTESQELKSYIQNRTRWRYYRNSINLGVVGGRNLLLSRSSSNLLVFMDNDAELTTPVSSIIASAYKSDPNIGMVGYEGILLDPNLNDYTYRGIKMEVDAISGYFQCIPRSILTQVGLLTKYTLYGKEDIDYGLRVKERGYKNIILPGFQIKHIRHAASSTLNAELKNHAELLNKKVFFQYWSEKAHLFEVNRKNMNEIACIECDEVWHKKLSQPQN